MQKRCVSCRFWQPPDKGQTTGQCRHDPPRVFPITQGGGGSPLEIGGRRVQQQPQLGFMSAFPPIPAESWCGSWQPQDT